MHFNVPREWFETNSRHQRRYSEGGLKIRGCRGLLARVIAEGESPPLSMKSTLVATIRDSRENRRTHDARTAIVGDPACLVSC